ncbi:MAG: hypothetical protein IRY99_01950 [Isosphaeraceae bacterium]|nr:hypothetical protein [Isosphaeraceae bacterium]
MLVQGFLAVSQGSSGTAYAPNSSSLNTFLEPVLAASVQKQTPFTPLEETGDMPGVSPIAAAAIVAYPRIAYHSPYTINLSNALPGITRGLLPRTPFQRTAQTAWGPHKFNRPPKLPTGQGAAWLQQRLLTVYSQAIGVTYQHHYNPFWKPAQGSPWNVVSIGSQDRGIDCTNLTAFAYADALGIWMTGMTTRQAGIGITPGWQSWISIPPPLAGLVQVQILKPPAVRNQTTYQTFVNSLQPGDILFINKKPTAGKQPNPSGSVHAITYLGSYGSQDGSPNPNLIIDSTGNAPPHFDSNGKIIPGGVHIRPLGAPGTVNDWYFTHVDHVLRLIVPTPTQAPTGGSSNT